LGNSPQNMFNEKINTQLQTQLECFLTQAAAFI